MINRHSLMRPSLTAGQLLFLVAVWFAASQNLSFWREVLASLPPVRGREEWVFIGTLFVVLNAALVFCLGVLTPRPIIKPVLTALLLLAAACSYFMDTYRTVVDEPMMVNVMQTDVRESSELLVAAYWWHLLLQGLLPAIVVWRVRLVSAGFGRDLARRALLLVLALATFAGGFALQYKDFVLWARENQHVRSYLNPSYPVYSITRLIKDELHTAHKVKVKPIMADATRLAPSSSRPYIVVMVVGETARATNFQLNGYARATNPELSATEGLINFGNATSCGTSTAISVPCMFSKLGRGGFSKNRVRSQEDVLDVLARSGVDVRWLDNNSGCKGTCKRVPYEDLSNGPSAAFCDAEGCYDGVLLENFSTRLPHAGQSRLIVLHQKGSHGPAYYRRYPEEFRHFLPECEKNAVQTCSRDEIVNAYDNSILYTDHVLASLIAELRKQQDNVDSVVLYFSDHGESLGEDGVYLHGLPYAVAPVDQKHVPFMAWFSQQAAQRLGIDVACVQAGSAQAHSHDDLFDTLLALFGVRAPGYDAPLNVFKPCTAAAP